MEKLALEKGEEDYTIKEREQKNSALVLRLIETVENNFFFRHIDGLNLTGEDDG